MSLHVKMHLQFYEQSKRKLCYSEATAYRRGFHNQTHFIFASWIISHCRKPCTIFKVFDIRDNLAPSLLPFLPYEKLDFPDAASNFATMPLIYVTISRLSRTSVTSCHQHVACNVSRAIIAGSYRHILPLWNLSFVWVKAQTPETAEYFSHSTPDFFLRATGGMNPVAIKVLLPIVSQETKSHAADTGSEIQDQIAIKLWVLSRAKAIDPGSVEKHPKKHSLAIIPIGTGIHKNLFVCRIAFVPRYVVGSGLPISDRPHWSHFEGHT